MPVVGFNITSVDAKAHEEKKSKGGISISSTPNVENVTKKDLNISGFKNVIAIEFTFTTKYDPKVGEINFAGEVLYQTDDYKKILDNWETKKLDASIATEVLNTIFRKCLAKAVSIADDLRLPPPVNFPSVKEEKAARQAQAG